MNVRVRKSVAAMSGYVPGEQPTAEGVLKLNTNENPYPPSPRVFEAIHSAADSLLRKYPDPLANDFRTAAAGILDVPAHWILATNGSDEALTLLVRATLDTGGRLLAPTPSYLLYRVLAAIQGCGYEERPFTLDWSLPDDFVDGADLTIVPNPNSPSGSILPLDRIAYLAERARGVLVVDEAYVDFSQGGSAVSLVRRFENLAVTRTLSKSYALAGLRFGFVVAQPGLLAELCKVKDSYNVDRISIAAARAAILDRDYLADIVERIRATREHLAERLRTQGWMVLPSEANFLWIRHSQPLGPVAEGLRRDGILVRHLTYPEYGEGLRITIGTADECDRCASALAKWVHEPTKREILREE